MPPRFTEDDFDKVMQFTLGLLRQNRPSLREFERKSIAMRLVHLAGHDMGLVIKIPRRFSTSGRCRCGRYADFDASRFVPRKFHLPTWLDVQNAGCTRLYAMIKNEQRNIARARARQCSQRPRVPADPENEERMVADLEGQFNRSCAVRNRNETGSLENIVKHFSDMKVAQGEEKQSSDKLNKSV